MENPQNPPSYTGTSSVTQLLSDHAALRPGPLPHLLPLLARHQGLRHLAYVLNPVGPDGLTRIRVFQSDQDPVFEIRSDPGFKIKSDPDVNI